MLLWSWPVVSVLSLVRLNMSLDILTFLHVQAFSLYMHKASQNRDQRVCWDKLYNIYKQKQKMGVKQQMTNGHACQGRRMVKR